MKIFALIIILSSSIFLVYINVWFYCKTNFTKELINVNIVIKLFKHKFHFNRKIYYMNVAKILLDMKKGDKKEKNIVRFKHLFKYRRYFKIFIIKNIYLFPEVFESEFSVALEFYIVNTLLKKSILNS